MFLGPFWTYPNCQNDICPGNITPCDICPYLEYLSYYWPDFDQTLKVDSWDNLEHIPTVTVTFAKILSKKDCQKNITQQKFRQKKIVAKNICQHDFCLKKFPHTIFEKRIDILQKVKNNCEEIFFCQKLFFEKT